MPKKLHIIHSSGGSRLWPESDDCHAKQSLKRLRRIIIRDITPKTRVRIVEHLRELEAGNPELPVTLIFDSVGGDIEEVAPINQELRRLARKCPVRAIACGQTHSSAVTLFLGCAKRSRFAASGASMLLHHTRTRVTLVASTRAEMAAKARERIAELWKIERRDRAWIAARTGLKPRTVASLCRSGQFEKKILDPHMMQILGFAFKVLDDFHPLRPHPVLDGWLG